ESDDDDVTPAYNDEEHYFAKFAPVYALSHVFVHEQCFRLACAWSDVDELDFFRDATGKGLLDNDRGHWGYRSRNDGDPFVRYEKQDEKVSPKSQRSTALTPLDRYKEGSLFKEVRYGKLVLQTHKRNFEFHRDTKILYFRPDRFPALRFINPPFQVGSDGAKRRLRNRKLDTTFGKLTIELFQLIVEWLEPMKELGQYETHEISKEMELHSLHELELSCSLFREVLMSKDFQLGFWKARCKLAGLLPTKLDNTKSGQQIWKVLEEASDTNVNWWAYYDACRQSPSMIKRAYTYQRVLDIRRGLGHV
ncbi:hypothetical protein HDU76_010414, partial [Blyttiomyces sp. JEL0837]